MLRGGLSLLETMPMAQSFGIKKKRKKKIKENV